MNKIQIDGQEENLVNQSGLLEVKSDKCLIHLSGKNYFTQLKFPKSGKLIFDLQDHATFFLEDTWTTQNKMGTIIINSHNHNILKWNLAIYPNEDYHLKIDNQIKGNNNQTEMIIRAVNKEEGSCYIESHGTILPNTKNNKFKEELKGLAIQKKTITFLPNLIVHSNDVEAHHNATIRTVNQNELFYLQSKGLSKQDAINLIIAGFLKVNSKIEEVTK